MCVQTTKVEIYPDHTHRFVLKNLNYSMTPVGQPWHPERKFCKKKQGHPDQEYTIWGLGVYLWWFGPLFGPRPRKTTLFGRGRNGNRQKKKQKNRHLSFHFFNLCLLSCCVNSGTDRVLDSRQQTAVPHEPNGRRSFFLSPLSCFSELFKRERESFS